jgi:hypothetical protein
MYQTTGLGAASQLSNTQAAAANAIGAAFGIPDAGALINRISSALGVGAGRNEADQITPTQNDLGAFLAQVSAYIPTAPSVAALQQLASNLSNAWTKFQNFIFNGQQFPDGRASHQAYATISPLVTTLQNQISARAAQLGGSVSLTPTQSGYLSLQVPTYGVAGVPQAGTLPYYPPMTYPNQTTISAQLSANIGPLILAGGLAWLLFGRR